MNEKREISAKIVQKPDNKNRREETGNFPEGCQPYIYISHDIQNGV